MKRALLAVAILCLFSSAAEAGRAPPHNARWVVPASTLGQKQVTRGRGGYYAIGNIVPARIFRLSENAVVLHKGAPVVVIPGGTLMIPLEDDPQSACVLRTLAGSNFACLSDRDNDGVYDTYFGTQVFNEIFFGSIGDDGAFTALSKGVELAQVDPKTETPRIDLAIKPHNVANGRLKYTACVYISWDSRYYDEPSCTVKPQEASLDSSGRATIYGQTVGLSNIKSSTPSIEVQYGLADFDFPTFWRFP